MLGFFRPKLYARVRRGKDHRYHVTLRDKDGHFEFTSGPSGFASQFIADEAIQFLSRAKVERQSE